MGMIKLSLPSDTTLGLPVDPHTHEPRYERVNGRIEVAYTTEELAWALAAAGYFEATLRLLSKVQTTQPRLFW